MPAVWEPRKLKKKESKVVTDRYVEAKTEESIILVLARSDHHIPGVIGSKVPSS
jgi:hypothetical protein